MHAAHAHVCNVIVPAPPPLHPLPTSPPLPDVAAAECWGRGRSAGRLQMAVVPPLTATGRGTQRGRQRGGGGGVGGWLSPEKREDK